jgi:ABC-type glycerol-3-phosphate transport system substrate-binding protein
MKIFHAISPTLILGFALGCWTGLVYAAQTKQAWQVEWEKTVEAAKQEGQVTVCISGYDAVLPDFQKDYPEIKVVAVTGRGNEIGQRIAAERRGERFIADVVSAGVVNEALKAAGKN